MKENVFIAKIYWLSPDEGGRKTGIPMNQKNYAPIVAFEEKMQVLDSAWSLLCYSFEKKSDSESLAYIRYLNQLNNPNNIKVGLHFELFEGGKKVAYGKVIEETEFSFN